MITLEQLQLRPATPDDLDTLVRFNAAMALETEGRALDLDRLRQGVRAVFDGPTRGFYVVAELPAGPAKQVLGQLLVTYEWSDWRNAVFWWIQSVYVDPAWRRQGVYRRLHQYVLKQARSRTDVCGVRLYVETDNHGAQTAYRRVGLSRTSYQVFEDDFVLARRATPPSH